MSQVITKEKIKPKINNLLKISDNATEIREILKGLFAENRYISSKYFYDYKGSLLFEDITRLKEYYPAKAEKQIINKYAVDILNKSEPKSIVELGSGDPSKIDIFLAKSGRAEDFKYIPVDISESAINESCHFLNEKYPNTEIEAYVLDFTNQIQEINEDKKKIFGFLGGTLGNFSRDFAVNFLKNLRKQMNYDDYLLIGTDRVKDKNIIEKAYNDDKGVTANFNKNILNNINNILKSDFNPDEFSHKAFYNDKMERIEMHLIANKNMSIKSKYFDNPLFIKQGENINTEISNKFSESRINKLAEASCLKISEIFTDDNNLFSLILLQKT